MSQNDFNIANQGFPATRADINSALQALASNSAGTAEPSTTYAYQFWYDETNELLKMRNSDNDAWITIGTFDQVADTFTPAGVTTDKIEEGNSSVEVVDTGTGYVAITVDGVEAARVDGSGNLIVGKTSESGSTAGHFFSKTGYQRSTRNGGIQILNRISSDGSLIDLQRDGSAVGEIGASNTRLHIVNGDTGLRFAGNNDAIWPCTTGGGDRDAAIDLGSSGIRFKNFYLSGGVYLGGTGAANYLDDYEEGTWTPVLSFGGGTTGLSYNSNGLYRKVGGIVTIQFSIGMIAKGSSTGVVQIQNLPFVTVSGKNFSGTLGYNYNLPNTDTAQGHTWLIENTAIYLMKANDSGFANQGNLNDNSVLAGNTITYMTDA